MPFNTAAWLPAARAELEVKPAPYTAPRAGEIVVKTHAVAINPFDWIIQVVGDLIFSFVKYPCILGSDLAGEVVEVGEGVTRFKLGDRVLAHAISTDPKRNSPADGAFQTYAIALAHMASPIPDALSYERACVLPLGLSTAACGLFQKDHLALAYPTTPPATPNGRTLLVWGGSTSVGSNAIQLAVAAGYEVVTTASPRNFDYVRRLGAAQAFDHSAQTVVSDITKALQGKTMAGALAVGPRSAEACLDILHGCKGAKFVSLATPPISFADLAEGGAVRLRFLGKVAPMLWGNLALALKSRVWGLRNKFIYGSSLMNNEVGRLIYEDFLPSALAEGQYVPAPDPQVIGHGLAYVQAGLDAQRKGVSAKKVVVTL